MTDSKTEDDLVRRLTKAIQRIQELENEIERLRRPADAEAVEIEEGSVAHYVLALVAALTETGRSPDEIRAGLKTVTAYLNSEIRLGKAGKP